MTLDEAIQHCKEVAIEYEAKGECYECGKEHRQLAEWLEDYKQLKETTRWIPCSERLPDVDGNYIVMRANAVEILEYSAEMELFGFTEEYKDEIGYNITEWYTVGGVSDWMPIPSKEGGEP